MDRVQTGPDHCRPTRQAAERNVLILCQCNVVAGLAGQSNAVPWVTGQSSSSAVAETMTGLEAEHVAATSASSADAVDA